MEPLKRKILFNRSSGKSVEPKNEGEKPVESAPEKEVYDAPKKPVINDEPLKFSAPKEVKKDTRTRSEKVIEWFGSHELISVNGVCQEAIIDTSNFTKLLKAARVIPDKILDKIEPIIKQYGYE